MIPFNAPNFFCNRYQKLLTISLPHAIFDKQFLLYQIGSNRWRQFTERIEQYGEANHKAPSRD